LARVEFDVKKFTSPADASDSLQTIDVKSFDGFAVKSLLFTGCIACRIVLLDCFDLFKELS